MGKKHISLKDIARELNISISTVSRALKNHPDVSSSVTEKVQALAKQWRYSPNPLAMGLLKQKSGTIGVIVPDLVSYFFSSVITGIENYSKDKGYSIVIATSQESYEKELECIENLLNLRVDGLLVCLSQHTSDYSHFNKVWDAEVPLVFFDRVCRTNDFSSVVADNVDAAKSIILHFYETGASRIAFIAGPAHLSITRERTAGYLKGLKACSLKPDNNLLVNIDLNLISATEATFKLLKLPNPPDAIFTINDTMAFAIMKEIKKHGLRIPEDIALIGFTDEFHATVVEPTLTSVMHPTYEMGQEAAHLLLSQIESLEPHFTKQVVMKTHLVVRESSMKVIKNL